MYLIRTMFRGVKNRLLARASSRFNHMLQCLGSTRSWVL